MYPEPFRRTGSKYYCFWYVDPNTGKRSQKSTKQTAKRKAVEFIKKYIDALEKDDDAKSRIFVLLISHEH